MTGDELNGMYGTIISPEAAVAIPEHWMAAVHDALASFRDLPSSIRAFMIVTGIRAENGLVIEIGGVPDALPPDGLQRIGEIVETAQAAVKASMH